jgi:hypothetical protein
MKISKRAGLKIEQTWNIPKIRRRSIRKWLKD